MVDQNNERASGKTTAEEITKEVADEIDEPINVELPEEREKSFQTPGFSRLRMTWRGHDAAMIGAMHDAVDQKVFENFSEAFTILNEIYELVREKVMLPGGRTATDEHGFPVWAKNEAGNFVENWHNLNFRERERFLFLITTRLVAWEQRAAGAWAEAMMSKAIWEESFATGFESAEGSRPTVDDRTNRGRLASKEDRYFAVYCTYYSRKADSLVRNMAGIAQRLKDVHVVNGR
jgi:hypothetical protein